MPASSVNICLLATSSALSMNVNPLCSRNRSISRLTFTAFSCVPLYLVKLIMISGLVLYIMIAMWVPFSEMSYMSVTSLANFFTFTQFLRPILPDESSSKAKSIGIGQPTKTQFYDVNRSNTSTTKSAYTLPASTCAKMCMSP